MWFSFENINNLLFEEQNKLQYIKIYKQKEKKINTIFKF